MLIIKTDPQAAKRPSTCTSKLQRMHQRICRLTIACTAASLVTIAVPTAPAKPTAATAQLSGRAHTTPAPGCRYPPVVLPYPPLLPLPFPLDPPTAAQPRKSRCKPPMQHLDHSHNPRWVASLASPSLLLLLFLPCKIF